MRLKKISIGKIAGTHGIRGEVRVLLRGKPPDFLSDFRTFHVGRVPMTVESVRMHKGMALVKFQGVDTMDAALALKGGDVSIDRDAAAVPPEYYFDDELPGMRVYDADGNDLGELILVEPYPAGNIYTVRGERTFQIPAVKDVFIRSVDLDANRMEVNLWEGL